MASMLSPAPKETTLALVAGVGAVAPLHRRGILADHLHLDARERHRRLAETQVGEAQQHAIAGIAGHQRRERLVLQVGPCRPARSDRRSHHGLG